MKALLACLAVVATSGLHAQLLSNPGFESGMEGWKTNEQTPISTVTKEAAHTGEMGLRVNDQIETDGARFFSDAFTVSPGQKVTISFWARSSQGDTAAVSLQSLGARNRAITGENGQPPLVIGIKASADWKQYSGSCIVPDEAESMIIGIRSWTKAKGVVDIDDFELTVE